VQESVPVESSQGNTVSNGLGVSEFPAGVCFGARDGDGVVDSSGFMVPVRVGVPHGNCSAETVPQSPVGVAHASADETENMADCEGQGVGVRVFARVGVCVFVQVGVGVSVDDAGRVDSSVARGLGVGLGVDVAVAVRVGVGVPSGVRVRVDVAVRVRVGEGVRVRVGEGVRVERRVGVAVCVCVVVAVCVVVGFVDRAGFGVWVAFGPAGSVGVVFPPDVLLAGGGVIAGAALKFLSVRSIAGTVTPACCNCVFCFVNCSRILLSEEGSVYRGKSERTRW
jgi:hypothetical protein